MSQLSEGISSEVGSGEAKGEIAILHKEMATAFRRTLTTKLLRYSYIQSYNMANGDVWRLEVRDTAVFGPISKSSGFVALGASTLSSLGIYVLLRNHIIVVSIYKVIFLQVMLEELVLVLNMRFVQKILFNRFHGFHVLRISIVLCDDRVSHRSRGSIQ